MRAIINLMLCYSLTRITPKLSLDSWVKTRRRDQKKKDEITETQRRQNIWKKKKTINDPAAFFFFCPSVFTI